MPWTNIQGLEKLLSMDQRGHHSWRRSIYPPLSIHEDTRVHFQLLVDLGQKPKGRYLSLVARKGRVL